MDQSEITIKCITVDGRYTIETLNIYSHVELLQAEVYRLTLIKPEVQRIMTGPNLKPIDLVPELFLFSVGIQSGTTIFVEAVMDGDDAFERGEMRKQIVPSNNSSLFASLQYCQSQGIGSEEYKTEKAYMFRVNIAKAVQKNIQKYTKEMLGMNPHDYCSWIMNPNYWGGDIELSIISDVYEHEICVIDVPSLSMHRFGENRDYTYRVFLIHEKRHYDPLVNQINELTLRGYFKVKDILCIDMAMEYVRQTQCSLQISATSFVLKCMSCSQRVLTDNEARQHAWETQHADFEEE